MKEFISLSGQVSNVSLVSTTSGSMSTFRGTGSGSVSTHHKLRFRVGSKPVFFNSDANISDGDEVTVIGHGGGELKAVVIKNESTGASYSQISPSLTAVVCCALFSWIPMLIPVVAIEVVNDIHSSIIAYSILLDGVLTVWLLSRHHSAKSQIERLLQQPRA